MNIDKRIGEFALVLKFQVSELSAVGCETQLFIRTTLTAQREIWRRMIDAHRDRFSTQSTDTETFQWSVVALRVWYVLKTKV